MSPLPALCEFLGGIADELDALDEISPKRAAEVVMKIATRLRNAADEALLTARLNGDAQ
jgi:hypothetical protein